MLDSRNRTRVARIVVECKAVGCRYFGRGRLQQRGQREIDFTVEVAGGETWVHGPARRDGRVVGWTLAKVRPGVGVYDEPGWEEWVGKTLADVYRHIAERVAAGVKEVKRKPGKARQEQRGEDPIGDAIERLKDGGR